MSLLLQNDSCVESREVLNDDTGKFLVSFCITRRSLVSARISAVLLERRVSPEGEPRGNSAVGDFGEAMLEVLLGFRDDANGEVDELKVKGRSEMLTASLLFLLLLPALPLLPARGDTK
jgi:hypothetical protein